MCVHVRAVARLQLEVIEGVVPEKGGWTGWTEPCPRNGSGVAVCRAGFSGDCWLFGRDLYTALVYNASTLFGPFSSLTSTNIAFRSCHALCVVDACSILGADWCTFDGVVSKMGLQAPAATRADRSGLRWHADRDVVDPGVAGGLRRPPQRDVGGGGGRVTLFRGGMSDNAQREREREREREGGDRRVAASTPTRRTCDVRCSRQSHISVTHREVKLNLSGKQSLSTGVGLKNRGNPGDLGSGGWLSCIP